MPSYVKSEFTFKEISGCNVLPTSGRLAGGLLADGEEIGQPRGTLRETGGYFTLVRAMNFSERDVSENTMFLDWGVGEGGGPGVGMGGREVNEKRRFVVCAPIVFPTHGPHQTDAQTCARIRMRFVPQPAAED